MSGEAEQKTEKTYDALCRLVAAWVNGVSPEIEETPDFNELFLAADRHLLSAAVCAALERAGLMEVCPPEIAKRFQQAKFSAVRKTLLMDRERKAILDFLEESGIWYLPLKGVVLNGVYPQYGTRQFTDNDILFDAARWREVRDFMKRRGYRAKGVGTGADDAYLKPPIYNFELHRRLFTEVEKPPLTAVADYYGDVKRLLVRDQGNRFGYHLRDEDFYVYYLAHGYKHWNYGGTGLRTVLDVYLYRRARPDMDETYIAGELQKLGLTGFDVLFRTLGEKLFGPTPARTLTGEEQKTLAWLESSGAYGTPEHTVQSDLRQLQGDEGPVGGRTRVKYLLRRLFPDREWYRINAPFAYHHGWARPIFWLRWVVRCVFVNGGRSFRLLREICFPPEGKSILRLGAEKAKKTISRPFRKPASQWPLEKRVKVLMQSYERREGHTFDLDHPELFTEKLVWYALFFHHPDLPHILDKYLFKGYIEEKLGPGYTARLYGMWTDMRSLKRDWDSLPDTFCLKSSCSSSAHNLMIIRDRKSIDTKKLFREVRGWLAPKNTDIDTLLEEYADIVPRIIAEELFEGNNGQLYDYKAYCFDGVPAFFGAMADRLPIEKKAVSFAYYDLDWNKLPVAKKGHPNRDVPKPRHIDTMLSLATKLSQGFPFMRVDFYEQGDRVYIGELACYSGNHFDQEEWDRKIGQKFILPFERENEN